MNALLGRLAALCRDHVVDEKILVVPSLAIGHQIGDRIAQTGTPWINLRVETVRTLADAVASFDLVRQGAKVLSRAQALSFVEKACDRALRGESYFAAIADRPGFHRAMQRSIDDLRLAGVQGVEVRASRFEEKRKAGDLERVLKAYEEELAAGPYVDRCAVLRHATELLVGGARAPFGDDAVWIVVEEMELASTEERFLELVSENRVLRLVSSPDPGTGVAPVVESSPSDAVDAPGPEYSSRHKVLRKKSLMRSEQHIAGQLQLFAPSTTTGKEILPASKDGHAIPSTAGAQIEFRRAIGEENEIRGAFRSILRHGIGFDQSELIYTERSTYLPLIYELASEYGIPATYAEGISSSFTRPGAAALGFLSWIGADHQSAEMEKILRSGAIDLYGGRTSGPSARAVARVLREASIGWGRERYLSCIEIWRKGRQSRLSDEELSEGRIRAISRDVEAASVAEEFFGSVLGLTETLASLDVVQMASVADATASFVSAYAAVRNEIDAMSKRALERMLNELAALPTMELPRGEASDRLRRAVIELHVAASNPRPGHLHVAPVRLGGWAGRREISAVGLDDSRHPGGAAQDPVLLDAERRALNGKIVPRKLSMLSERPERNFTDFARFLRRARSHGHAGVTPRIFLSYSYLDLREQRGRYPSSTLLHVYRDVSQQPEITYETLLEKIAADTSSFVPHDGALTGSEWWFTQVFDGHHVETLQEVEGAYRWLRRGKEATAARQSDSFTPWDGAIQAPAQELDPRVSGAVLSASRLEKLAGCPFRYFLDHVLRVQPLEAVERDPERWLTPADFGNMLHEVLQVFMEEICASGEKPLLSRHAARLNEIAGASVRKWAARVPPPNTSALERQQQELLDACEIFLKTEERECGSITARYFEAGFGDGAQPLPEFSIDLGDGRRLRLRGRIDRVDRADDDSLWDVWDYKSGSIFRFERGGRFRQGTRIQHAVYARVVEAILAASGEKGSVRRSGYYFPSRKGDGLRHAITVAPGELEQVLNLLCDVAASGTFLHASEDHCRFCDYAPVCGDVRRAAEQSRRKIEQDRENRGVRAWVKLQGVE